MRRNDKFNHEQYLRALSHELRSPLTKMLFFIEAMQASEKIEEHELENLRTYINDLKVFTEKFILHSRLDPSHYESTNTNFNPINIISSLISLHQQKGDIRNLTIKLDDQTQQNTIYADCDLLRYALSEIFSNAVRYSHRNIVIQALISDSSFIIVVSDDGPGIPAHERPYVTEPFYRIDKSRNKATGGIGMGLAIAHRAIRNLGGDLHFNCDDLIHTNVRIELPLTK